MTPKKITLKVLITACCLAASAAICVAQTSAPTNTASILPSVTSTNRLAPTKDDGTIAYLVARLLENMHYLRLTLNDDLSEKFYDRYLKTLDSQHIYFIQADLDEFSSLRTRLDDLTLGRRNLADTSPAFTIFNRFLERLEQRTDYVESVLKAGDLDFSGDERVLIDRREEAAPADLDEAKKLWRERIRAEFLQEKLALIETKKKSDRAKTNNLPPATDLSMDARPKSDVEEITEKLIRGNRRMLNMFKELNNGDVLERYLSALANVYDPHSDYMGRSQAENFAIGMSLSLFGIGAELGFDDGYCVIRKLHPGPAAKSKQIKEGDKIVAVAQGGAAPVDVVEMPLNKAVQLIRGAKDTEVRLTIIPVDSPTERRVIPLVRDEIKLVDQEAKADIIDFPTRDGKTVRLGVIDLPSFYATVSLPNEIGHSEPRSTTKDVAGLLKKLNEEQVAGIVLDLRRNGGGSLEEVVNLTGLFIKEGPVVQIREPDNDVFVDRDDDPTELYKGPLVVLTSRFSASASEILAAALQDYARALVVGDISTHGKGTVQNVNPLARWPIAGTVTGDPGLLKMTIRKFYRATGASTQLRGVMPDVVLPSVFNYSKYVGESALDNPWIPDTIPSTSFEKYNLVEPFLNDLLKLSNQRLQSDMEFAYIREDIERFRKDQSDKTISLNEKTRLKEMDDLDARHKGRQKERLARKTVEPTRYEIKLAGVDTPGLPLPVGQTNTPLTFTSGTGVDSDRIDWKFTNTVTATTTNSISIAAPGSSMPKATEPEISEDAWRQKAALQEAESILADYVRLLQQKGTIIVKAIPEKLKEPASTVEVTP